MPRPKQTTRNGRAFLSTLAELHLCINLSSRLTVFILFALVRVYPFAKTPECKSVVTWSMTTRDRAPRGRKEVPNVGHTFVMCLDISCVLSYVPLTPPRCCEVCSWPRVTPHSTCNWRCRAREIFSFDLLCSIIIFRDANKNSVVGVVKRNSSNQHHPQLQL